MAKCRRARIVAKSNRSSTLRARRDACGSADSENRGPAAQISKDGTRCPCPRTSPCQFERTIIFASASSVGSSAAALFGALRFSGASLSEGSCITQQPGIFSRRCQLNRAALPSAFRTPHPRISGAGFRFRATANRSQFPAGRAYASGSERSPSTTTSAIFAASPWPSSMSFSVCERNSSRDLSSASHCVTRV